MTKKHASKKASASAASDPPPSEHETLPDEEELAAGQQIVLKPTTSEHETNPEEEELAAGQVLLQERLKSKPTTSVLVSSTVRCTTTYTTDPSGVPVRLIEYSFLSAPSSSDSSRTVISISLSAPHVAASTASPGGDSTGLHVWSGAAAFCSWLWSSALDEKLSRLFLACPSGWPAGCKVLELGAGAGALPSLFVGSLLFRAKGAVPVGSMQPKYQVVATDDFTNTQLAAVTAGNVSRNAATHGGLVETSKLVIGDKADGSSSLPSDLRPGEYDVLLGSELVYDSLPVSSLASTAAALLSPGGSLLLFGSNECRLSGKRGWDYVAKEMQDKGLTLEETVALDGEHAMRVFRKRGVGGAGGAARKPSFGAKSAGANEWLFANFSRDEPLLFHDIQVVGADGEPISKHDMCAIL